ncbi:MAG: hypothetical protein GY854_02250 [Deltaproteobacteria bacterium]|nr:hypothetical protein [Deltaproteobacteria bacterium]
MRLRDSVKIERVGGSGANSVLDHFTSFVLVNDITQPSEASFELGNDGTWDSIADLIAIGTEYSVFLNDQLRLIGRVEMADIPVDASGGSVVRFTARTKLADAMYASADPSVGVKKTSVKDFVLALYAPLGYAESDFVFEANVARDLLTGVSTDGQGKPKKVDLEPMKIDAARVQATESVFDAADRHLRRHGLMHWDSPDGKIVISAPNDTQKPQYFLRLFRGKRGRENNFLSATRTMDYSEIPSRITVHGRTSGPPRKKLKSVVEDSEVAGAGFYRPVVIPSEGLKMQSLVDRAAAREMSARSKRKDCWEIEIDGLSWWDGYKNTPWAVDAVCEIDSDVAGGPVGAYYVHRVMHRCDAMQGDITNISVLKSGIWRL